MGRGVHAPKGCNEVWTIDFKGWFRTGDGKRCEPLTVRDLFSRYVLAVVLLPNQSDAAVRRAMVQSFVVMACPKSFGWTMARPLAAKALWPLAPECVVAALGDRGGVRPASSPRRHGAHEQMHRVLRTDVAKPPAPSVTAQKRRLALGSGATIKCVLTKHWPARSCTDLLAEQSADAGAIVAGGISLGWRGRRLRNRGHIKWHGRERFIGRAFVGQAVGLKTVADGVHEVYFQQQLIGLLYARDRPECDRLQWRDILKP